jgi:uncharacterized membrane protein YqhA
MWQAIIHAVFVLSAIGIAAVERISMPVYEQGHSRKANHQPGQH